MRRCDTGSPIKLPFRALWASDLLSRWEQPQRFQKWKPNSLSLAISIAKEGARLTRWSASAVTPKQGYHANCAGSGSTYIPYSSPVYQNITANILALLHFFLRPAEPTSPLTMSTLSHIIYPLTPSVRTRAVSKPLKSLLWASLEAAQTLFVKPY